jgi:hypothetical protein
MASIAAITRADAPRLATSLLSAALGLALLGLALPRLIDEMALLRPAAVIAAGEAGVAVSDAGIAVAAQAAETATQGPVAARANRIAGQLHLAAAARRGGIDTIAGRAEFGRAAERLTAALAVSPGDRYAWWWLVAARWNSAQHLAAARAWPVAALSGLFDPSLMFARIAGGVPLWPYMDAAGRDAFAAQLAVHWQWGPGGLAELLKRRQAEAIVRQALAGRPDIADDLARRMAAQ